MEISFILTCDELFTLTSVTSGFSEAGKLFLQEALPDAELCDLSGLVLKKMARYVGEDMELSPVIRMISDAIAKADSATQDAGGWLIQSQWITLRLEKYAFQENCFKIVPLKDK